VVSAPPRLTNEKTAAGLEAGRSRPLRTQAKDRCVLARERAREPRAVREILMMNLFTTCSHFSFPPRMTQAR
jgi:hypothetical protein